MSNLLRKIAIGGAIVGFAAISLPAFGVVSDACKADLSQCTTEELTEYIAELSATLQALQNQLGALQGQGTTPTTPTASNYTGIPAGFTFTKNLYQGMRDQDVVYLKKVLDVEVPDHAPWTGSSYFGPKTKAAVIAFQTKYKTEISNYAGYTIHCTGFVGKGTRAQLNALLSATPPTPPAAACSSDADCDTGYKCQDGSCVKKSADEITTENECTAVGYYWYNDACHEEAQPAQAGLTVALADDNPPSATIIGGSTLVDLVRLTFTNGDSSDVKVTSLKVKRGGVSDDTDLPNLYLFDGYTRLGDEATLSSGYATFNNSNGLFTIPAGGSRTITVRAEVADSSGHTVQVSIESADDITSDASAVNGTFPLSGNLMSIASASSKAEVDFANTVLPSGDTNIDAATDYIIWSDSFTVSNQDVKLEYLRFSQIGSISADALDNIRLNLSGTQIATGELVAGDVGQTLVFDLSDSPVTITKGMTKTLTIYADIVKGAGKTMRMSLEKTADVFFKDASYGNYVLVTRNSSTFSALRTGTKTINTGTVAITKRTDSPGSAVVKSSSNVSLAKFDVKAMGEDIKINSLRVEAYITGTTSVQYLRNVSLFLDGTQVGNTKNVATNNAGTPYTDFNIYQKIPAGTTKVLEVKGDIYGCAASSCSGSNLLSSGNTIKIIIVGSSSLDNAQGMTSLSIIDAPSSNVNGTARTVGTGDLTLVKSTSYGDQNVAAGSDTKIGQYDLSATNYDTINISAMTVVVNTSGMSLSDLSNLYLKFNGQTTSAKGSVGPSNVFSVNTSLAPGDSMTVEVWATIGTTASSGQSCSTTLAVTATRATDGGDASKSAVTGQTITIQNGGLTVAKASDSPLSAIIVGDTTDQLLAKFTFSANYEAFTVDEMRISTQSTTTDDFTGVYLKYKDADGVTITTSPLPFVNGTSTFTGQTLYVPANDTADLEVYGNVNAVGAGYADTGDRPIITLKYAKASSNSSSTYVVATTTPSSGNQMLLYKTAPTVAISGTTAGTLVNGTNNLYSFTIGANSKGDVGVKKITFHVAPSMSTSSDTIGSFKFYRGSTDITDLVSITEGTATGTNLKTGNLNSSQSATSVVVVFNSEEVITEDTSQTYYLKANVTGVNQVGESISTYIKDDTSYASPATYSVSIGNFVWSDRSALSHSTSTSDWMNGYLVDTLATDAYTLSK